MNRTELRVEMMRHEDTFSKLSEVLGISTASLFNKMSTEKNSEFTQSEILKIKERYNLTNDRMAEIFFAKNMS